MISNHGSQKKYYNEIVGVNSRLDTLQAAILSVKLRHMDRYVAARQAAADRYDQLLGDLEAVTTPVRNTFGSHVFHQYTIRVDPAVKGGRDGLAEHLKTNDIPHAVYYPVPLHLQDCFAYLDYGPGDFPVAEAAAAEVLSIPIYPELTEAQLERVVTTIRHFLVG